MRRPVRDLTATVLVLLALVGSGSAQASPADENAGASLRLATLCALAGRAAEAESLFVLTLAANPRDPAALNGIGNLRAIAGKGAQAQAFYRAAERGAPDDPGIRLNRSLVLEHLLGLGVEARALWNAAAADAGGVEAAWSLLGHRAPEAAPAGAERGTDGDRVANARTPRPGAAPPRAARAERPRAIEAAFLYWKR